MTDASEIARWLADPANSRGVSDFPAGQRKVDSAGLYSWFVDDEGRRLFSSALSGPIPSLVYAGQAGATTRVSGSERVATLRSRIRGNHLRGNIGSSTFRKTLTAILRQPLCLELERPGKLSRSSSAIVSGWMLDHLTLTTCACPERATLASLEEDVLRLLDPPLNLMGMGTTPLRTRLKELRRALG